MRVDWKDVGAGLTYCLFGILGLLLGKNLQMGNPSEMGPGYVPRMVSIGLLGIGIVMTARGGIRSSRPGGFPRFRWGTAAIVLGSVISFAFALEHLGVVAATAMLVTVAAFAGGKPQWRETGLLIVCLSVLVVLVFVKGLSVHMRIWPW
jgi:hypothetical protein